MLNFNSLGELCQSVWDLLDSPRQEREYREQARQWEEQRDRRMAQARGAARSELIEHLSDLISMYREQGDAIHRDWVGQRQRLVTYRAQFAAIKRGIPRTEGIKWIKREGEFQRRADERRAQRDSANGEVHRLCGLHRSLCRGLLTTDQARERLGQSEGAVDA